MGRDNCARVLLLLALLSPLGCADENTSNGASDGADDGSDWMTCALDVDCSAHPEAIRCNDDGYCEDAVGGRVAKLDDPSPGTTGDAGGQDPAMTCEPSTETCNGVDDDCDGVSDEAAAADADCESRMLNAVTFCDDTKGTCVPVKCLSGFAQCDGDPNNGCEPATDCGCPGCGGSGDDAGL